MIFKDAVKIQNVTFISFCWRKNSKKLKSEIIEISQAHSNNMEMCKFVFQDFTEIQNGLRRTKFTSRKSSKQVVLFYILNYIPNNMDVRFQRCYQNTKRPPQIN